MNWLLWASWKYSACFGTTTTCRRFKINSGKIARGYKSSGETQSQIQQLQKKPESEAQLVAKATVSWQAPCLPSGPQAS